VSTAGRLPRTLFCFVLNNSAESPLLPQRVCNDVMHAHGRHSTSFGVICENEMNAGCDEVGSMTRGPQRRPRLIFVQFRSDYEDEMALTLPMRVRGIHHKHHVKVIHSFNLQCCPFIHEYGPQCPGSETSHDCLPPFPEVRCHLAPIGNLTPRCSPAPRAATLNSQL
jgi:hypothetical protein